MFLLYSDFAWGLKTRAFARDRMRILLQLPVHNPSRMVAEFAICEKFAPHIHLVCVHVCVRVCERERVRESQREGERERENVCMLKPNGEDGPNHMITT